MNSQFPSGRLAIVALSLLVLAGCTPPPGADQKLRQELFFKCLEKAPAGPVSTKYNDWSEVVDSCGSQAYYMAK